MKEPMMMILDLPTSAWDKVGMDLFHLKGNNYLVGIDCYSNYPELISLKKYQTNISLCCYLIKPLELTVCYLIGCNTTMDTEETGHM